MLVNFYSNKELFHINCTDSFLQINKIFFFVNLQLQGAFQEKEDENLRLKHYIDTILLNIVENYPQILEVKTANGPEKR